MTGGESALSHVIDNPCLKYKQRPQPATQPLGWAEQVYRRQRYMDYPWRYGHLDLSPGGLLADLSRGVWGSGAAPAKTKGFILHVTVVESKGSVSPHIYQGGSEVVMKFKSQWFARGALVPGFHVPLSSF